MAASQTINYTVSKLCNVILVPQYKEIVKNLTSLNYVIFIRQVD